MTPEDRYDAIVIGTGQAGKPLARALGAAGMRTAIVERGHVGGTCVNVGCTPTKTIVASARIAHLARRSADFGIEAGDVRVDLARVVRRKDEVVTSFRDGSRQRLEQASGVDLVFGDARFTGPKRVTVAEVGGGERVLSAERVFVNAGTRPRIPDLDGLDDVPFLTSATILDLETVPEHLIVLGGGYVGVELGQAFRRFGAEVTIVQRGEQILPHEDADVAEALMEILCEEGVKVLTGSEATAVSPDGSGGVRVSVESPDGSSTLEGSHLLVAVGRVPNTVGLGLDAAGVAVDDRGYVVVDGRLETDVPGVYALGDVKGGPAFTHIAYDDYRVVEANLLGDGNATTRERLVPYTVFTDPELGRVGMTEREAREKEREVRIATLPMASAARAIERGETRGFMKAVVDGKTDRILGFAILGIEGGEIASVVQVAMMGDLPYTALRDGVFSHPTLAESLNNLFLTLDG